ncbi:MAG TPA: hypothetical protein VL574_01980 [Stellaceae bacterium]|jgi:hypothetical protein|nr:hypothetical protein [Stellaceae bacterium]
MGLEAASALYRQGRYPEAQQQALASSDQAEFEAALMLVVKCYVAMGDVDGLGRMLAVNKQNGVPPERSLFFILRECLADGHYQQLIALDQAILPGNILHPVALYHASCARMMLGQEDEALAGFDRFRHAMRDYFDRFPLLVTNNDINVMFRQGTLVLPAQATAAQVAAGAAMAPVQSDFEMVRPRITAGEGPILACCADARYIEFFVPRWLESMAMLGFDMHVHVVNPTTDSRALIEDLVGKLQLGGRLSASTSIDRYGTSTSFACARFEVVPLLLEHLGRTIVAIDIDVGATPRLRDLAANLPEAGFACFETGRREPASVHQASIMAFSADDAGLGFVRDLAAYCRPKLHYPSRLNWMLDQAALFSLTRLYARTRSDFRYVALDRFTGLNLADHVYGLAEDAEKFALKKASDSPANIDLANVAWEP